MKPRRRKINTDESGVAFIEFALCIPLLLIILFGTVEVARYFLAIQKTEKTIDLITDTIARSDTNIPSEALTAANLAALMSSVQAMMNPYQFGANGLVILTSVSQPNAANTPVINWQYCGGGTLAATSHIGAASGGFPKAPATMPAGFVMNGGEEVIIGEIFYNFSPITLQQMVGNISLYRVVVFIPRLSTLSGFNSNC